MVKTGKMVQKVKNIKKVNENIEENIHLPFIRYLIGLKLLFNCI